MLKFIDMSSFAFCFFLPTSLSSSWCYCVLFSVYVKLYGVAFMRLETKIILQMLIIRTKVCLPFYNDANSV